MRVLMDVSRWRALKKNNNNKDALKRKTLLPYHVVKEKKERKLYKTRNSRRRRRRQHGFLISGTTTARRMGPISDAGVLTAKAVGERKKKGNHRSGRMQVLISFETFPHHTLFLSIYIYCTSIYIYIYIDMIFFCSPLLYQEVMPRYDPEIRRFHFVFLFSPLLFLGQFSFVVAPVSLSLLFRDSV